MKSLIAILNKSTVVSNTDTAAWAQAIAYQVRNHLEPKWQKSGISVIYYSNESDVPSGAWKIYLLDNSDQQGALGYHDENPIPYGRVFAKTCIQYGYSVSATLSHEVLEAAIDPNVNLWADSGRGYAVALEVGDPVENDSYQINGVEVSNFVFPQWFDSQSTASRFDYLRKVSAPFTMSPNGYIIKLQEGQVSQEFGENYPEQKKAMKGLGSRTFSRSHVL